jgi:hypothetical protein
MLRQNSALKIGFQHSPKATKKCARIAAGYEAEKFNDGRWKRH